MRDPRDGAEAARRQPTGLGLAWALPAGRRRLPIPRLRAGDVSLRIPVAGQVRRALAAPDHRSADCAREILRGNLRALPYLRTLFRPHDSATFARDDPAPAFHELPMLVTTMLRRLRDGVPV